MSGRLEVLGLDEFTELSLALRSRRRALDRIRHAYPGDVSGFEAAASLVRVNGLIHRLDNLEHETRRDWLAEPTGEAALTTEEILERRG